MIITTIRRIVIKIGTFSLFPTFCITGHEEECIKYMLKKENLEIATLWALKAYHSERTDFRAKDECEAMGLPMHWFKNGYCIQVWGTFHDLHDFVK